MTNQSHAIRATVTIRLADNVGEIAAELWEITLENLSDRIRVLKIVPYLEWLLATPAADRGHTQYNRLFPEMSYEPELNAVLALHRATKKLGVLAADRPPQGFLASRVDFIGRAGSIWSPSCLEMPLDEGSFIEPHRAEACPTFDPIGSLLMELALDARGSGSLRLLIGCADDKDEAAGWVRALFEAFCRCGFARVAVTTPAADRAWPDTARHARSHIASLRRVAAACGSARRLRRVRSIIRCPTPWARAFGDQPWTALVGQRQRPAEPDYARLG